MISIQTYIILRFLDFWKDSRTLVLESLGMLAGLIYNEFTFEFLLVSIINFLTLFLENTWGNGNSNYKEMF